MFVKKSMLYFSNIYFNIYKWNMSGIVVLEEDGEYTSNSIGHALINCWKFMTGKQWFILLFSLLLYVQKYPW